MIRTVIAAAALLALGAWVAPRGADAQESQGSLDWEPCRIGVQQRLWPDGPEAAHGSVRFTCAEITVPIDHDDESLGSLTMPLVRLASTDALARIGTLFVNPGGPGISGIDFVVRTAPGVLPAEVRAAFDIVGFDPRGLRWSTPGRCWTSGALPDAGMPTPFSSDEIEAWLEADAQLRDACARVDDPLINHLSTANVARDLDVIRAAVGEPTLTYLGFSYGTMVGATYANLFPDRVRAMVLDSAIDPIAWTSGDGGAALGDGQELQPVTSRIGSHRGSQAALGEFFRLCDAAPISECPLSGRAADRFHELGTRLVEAPLVLTDVPGDTYSAHAMLADVLSALFDEQAWPMIGHLLADLEEAAVTGVVEPALVRDLRAIRVGGANSIADRAGVDPGQLVRQHDGASSSPTVLCVDSVNPDAPERWTAAATELNEVSYFGSLWTWSGSICAKWPSVDGDRFVGPWGPPVGAAVLVMNNEFDPSTPLEGAAAMADVLGGRLLPVDAGRGHIAMRGSSCASTTAALVLVTAALPQDAALSCTPDSATPFDTDVTDN